MKLTAWKTAPVPHCEGVGLGAGRGVLLSAVKRDEDLPRAEAYLAEAKRVASWE